MRRFPPTKGVTGYDFGYKPAFSLAVVPTRGPIKQQDTEDETPPVFCHDAYGDTLNAVISGVLECTGCYASTFSGFDFKVSFTGVNGSFVATWNALFSQWENASIGTITLSVYPSTDGTCTGDPAVDTQDARLEVTCHQESGKSVFLVFIFGTFGSILSAGGFIEDALPNNQAIGQCGTFPAGSPLIGYDGIVTLSA